MAFDSLQEKLTRSLRLVEGKGKLSQKNMEDTLRELRVALLESDVNYKVTKDFLARVSAEAEGQDVLNSIDPGQLLVKIVHDELVKLLGENQETEIRFKDNGLTVIMAVGLQGTGKTTHVAKMANLFKKQGKKVLLAACDVIRPAAIDQLITLGKSIDTEVFTLGVNTPALKAAIEAVDYAKKNGFDTVLIDTAGRLQIDEVLMQELKDIKDAVSPDEILLTVDALTGQDIVNVAKTFDDLLDVTGLIVTKFDGDAKGGAVLSVKAITGVPIKFTGVGEKIEDLEIFYPDRLAQRILGMGDVVSLVEKAQEEMDMKKAEEVTQHMLEGKFTLDDMLISIEQTTKMGSLSSIMKMLPGMGEYANMVDENQADKSIRKTRAIIQSMTKEERRDPSYLRRSHKQRIAKGSGTTVDDVNKLLNQYEKTKKVMKQMSAFKGLFGKM